METVVIAFIGVFVVLALWFALCLRFFALWIENHK